MKKLAHIIAVCGAMLQVSIPLGFWMLQQRAHSAVSQMDLSRPEDVDRIVSGINRTTQKLGTAYDHFTGVLVVALLGVTLFVFSISRLGYRRKWAFWFSCIYGGFLLLMFPAGTAFGLFLLIYALRHRKEFGGNHGMPSLAQAGAGD